MQPVSHVLSEKIGETKTLNRHGLLSTRLSEESRTSPLSLSNLDSTKIDDNKSLNKELGASSDIHTGTKSISEKFMYKDKQMTKRQLKKSLRNAGRKTGVDITTGCSRLIQKPIINNPILLEYRRNALLPVMVNNVESGGSGNSTKGMI